ncbi:MAG TPA: sulfatase-like hydrolase/transferase, partial [Dyadobacter sp.]|nr:sulfatase-like hydrolase/transferase [Dyadobacter sp.]
MTCVLCASNMHVCAQQKNTPNIIFIFSDDHAYQAIGAYGNKLARTPNIDRLAKEGVLLTNNIVTNSICGPSRATLLTGKYSHKNGYKRNDRTRFDTNQTLFPDLLRKNGYQTAWIGKMHLNSLPAGFDYWNILPDQGNYYNPDFITQPNDTTRYNGYVSDVITQFSTDWLDKRDQSKPFFMIVGHKATHREWLPDLQDLGAYDDVEFPLPANFYDDYKGRNAAREQDMTIEKTMRLKQDLKVNVDYEKDWTYNRFSPEQLKVFKAYYDKVSKEPAEKKLTGKSLTEWKYQRYMRDYLSTANSLDRNIGKLLDYVDKSGLAENTVVIYASDQGFYLGEHGWFDKRFIYEESLKTPFIIRYPGVTKAGSKVDDLVLNIDWAPTVL